ncbi:glutamate-rich WD repeat-containing protein 1 [Artemisia annua]|uniref:Glutamate-rich WD repeat-containing protein 1 n=1 Tax=Artemisia annua TaxID=35608 RepID=A0A2U1P8H6_ARTAN|nr:glutamate-rich WD repeat-containing protein 1 [Artemisia annua]
MATVTASKALGSHGSCFGFVFALVPRSGFSYLFSTTDFGVGGVKKGEGPSSSNGIPSIPTKVWQPGVDGLEEGEELQCDPSAYNSLHAFHIGWPCLRNWMNRLVFQLSTTQAPVTNQGEILFPRPLALVKGIQNVCVLDWGMFEVECESDPSCVRMSHGFALAWSTPGIKERVGRKDRVPWFQHI